MTSAQESVSDNDVERLLASLAGVVSAHVVASRQGEPIEIHVLASAELHPKQVVRNVESALSAGLGIQIDRRIVSVAQVRTPGVGSGGAPDGSGADDQSGDSVRNGGGVAAATMASPAADVAQKPSRLEYVRFESRRDGGYCFCAVVLRDGDTEFTGSGSAPDTIEGRAEAAARGVLQAVEQARSELRLDLDGAALSSSRGRRYVIISARAVLRRETVLLAGAAAMTRSPEEAGILATLQATNRWSG